MRLASTRAMNSPMRASRKGGRARPTSVVPAGAGGKALASPPYALQLYPADTSIRRGFASSRRGIVNVSTPSFKDASTFDVSKSSLTVKVREK